MRAVFKQDKIHMFTMTKVLNQNLYTPDEWEPHNRMRYFDLFLKVSTSPQCCDFLLCQTRVSSRIFLCFTAYKRCFLELHHWKCLPLVTKSQSETRKRQRPSSIGQFLAFAIWSLFITNELILPFGCINKGLIFQLAINVGWDIRKERQLLGSEVLH